MVARGSGNVINVASIAAFLPAPESATYAATKAFVCSFTESLHDELAGRACARRRRSRASPAPSSRREPTGPNRTTCPSSPGSSPTQVARATLDGAAAGRARVVPGAGYKALVGAAQVIPGVSEALARGDGPSPGPLTLGAQTSR